METFSLYDVVNEEFKSLTCDTYIYKNFQTTEEMDTFLLFHPYCYYIVTRTNPYVVVFAQFELPYWNGKCITTKFSYSPNPADENYEDGYKMYLMKDQLIERKIKLEEEIKKIEEIEHKIKSQ